MPDETSSFKHDTMRFDCLGMDLNNPVDRCKEGKFPLLKNVRSYQQGRIEPRQGIVKADASACRSNKTPIHSVRRLNDPYNAGWTRIVGTGDSLAYGQTSLAAPSPDVTGLSGKPLSMIPYRPDQDVSPWMYIFDENKTVKMKVAGTTQGVGLAAPTSAPTAAIGLPYEKVIITSDTYTDWVAAADAGTTSAINYKTDTHINTIMYDSGTTGWCCIIPHTITDSMQPGMHIVINTGGGSVETVMIHEMYPGSAATTVASITYDSGSTGLCTIQPTSPLAEIKPNALVYLNSSEYCRVLSVTASRDGFPSFRCVTTGTIADTHALQVYPTIRVYAVSNHAAAEGLRSTGTKSTFTYSTGVGTLTYTGNIDLSAIESGFPTNVEDYIAVSIRCADMSKVDEGEIRFALDATPNWTGNYLYYPFKPSQLAAVVANTQTYADQIRRSIIDRFVAGQAAAVSEEAKPRDIPQPGGPPERPANLPPETSPSGSRGIWGGTSRIDSGGSSRRGPGAVVEDTPQPGGSDAGVGGSSIARRAGSTTPTTPATSVPRSYTGGPSVIGPGSTDRGGPGSIRRMGGQGEMPLGNAQWHVIVFKVGDLQSSGTDKTLTLKNVSGLQLKMTVNATVEIQVSSWMLFGGRGPDTGYAGVPYYYRYRYRNSLTGAVSNCSPATRNDLRPWRSQVYITIPVYSNSDGVDYFDVERIGGTLSEWHYVGSVGNSGSPKFEDYMADDAIASNPELGNYNYQPWPVIGTPVYGSTSKISGTMITDASTSFETFWAPGTQIQIDGVTYTIDRVVSTSKLELVESVGYKSGGYTAALGWSVPEPLLLYARNGHTPTAMKEVPVAFGSFEDHVFGCGDYLNPGRLYWTNRYNPDGTKDSNWRDVTNASEPLMNGCVYNGRCYLFTTERMFEIFPAYDTPEYWNIVEVPGGKGLFAKWALAVGGDGIWFLARDGIYLTNGGQPVSVTDGDLFPLFPNEGAVGVDVNGVKYPNMTAANAQYFRLSYYADFLYFDYIDSTSAFNTLVMDTTRKAWYYDVYNPTICYHYGEEGENVNNMLCCGTDATTAYLYDMSPGIGDSASTFTMYVLTPSRDQGLLRNEKLYGDFLIDAYDPVGLEANVVPYYNNNVTAGTAGTLTAASTRAQTIFNLNSGSGLEYRNISLHVTCAVTSSVQPLLYGADFSYIVRPDDAKLRLAEWDDAGTPGDKWVQGILIEADTDNTARTVQVIDEAGTVQTTLTITHNGRVIKPYSWTGFFSHRMKLLPTDANTWKLYNWTWVFEPAPELTTTWETPDMTNGMEGFHHFREGYIAHVSTANLTLTVTIDGTQYTYTVTHNSGAYKKSYLVFQPAKGKYYRWKVTSSAGFRLYQQDCELRGKEWQGETVYRTIKPFGGPSVQNGAQI